MKKKYGFITTVAALIMFFGLMSPVQACQSNDCPAQGYTVTGAVTPGWGTTGGDLWHDVLKETASSTSGQHDDVGGNPYGVVVRPPTTQDLPNRLSPTNHNWTEVNYILVTGRGGQKALFSVGELDPRFGNKPLTLTLNKNKKDYDMAGLSREVKKVCNIEVVHAFTNMKNAIGGGRIFSPMLVVSGAGITPKTYDLTDLQALPQVMFDATTSSSNTRGNWTGPRLVDVLKDAGVDTRDMNSYIIVQSTDGYATLHSMYEATHEIGITDMTSCTSCVPGYILLGISDKLDGTIPGTKLNNGSCTDPESDNTTCSDSGFVRTIIPGDWQAGRWISNTAQIIVYKLHR